MHKLTPPALLALSWASVGASLAVYATDLDTPVTAIVLMAASGLLALAAYLLARP